MKTLALSLLGILGPIVHAQAQISDLNPIPLSGGIPELLGRIIRFLLGISGVAALLFFIIGGFKLLTSQGNNEKVRSGKDTIIWAVVGLVIAFGSYVLLNFVLTSVLSSE